MEDRVILVSLFVQMCFKVHSQSLGVKMLFSSWYREGIFLVGNYGQFLGRKGKVIKLFLHLLPLNCLQLKIKNMPKWNILGWHVLNPITWSKGLCRCAKDLEMSRLSWIILVGPI